MAGRTTNANSKEKIWSFDVTDPTLHPNGFTIYKVTCRVFIIRSPESLTEVVTWKRYNDFKQLYKSMLSLHKALHRKEEFPKFARPLLFGRFDESVIEERRQSALKLLQFIGKHHYLYNSNDFKAFIKAASEIKTGASGEVLKPSKLDILTEDKGERSDNRSPMTPTNQLPKEEVDSPASSEGMTDKSDQNGEEELDGVWNFPQLPDNISLNSYDDTDDTDVGEVDSSLATPLPDSDISFFDPLMSDDRLQPPETTLRTSNSWLFTAMNTCAEMENELSSEDQDLKTDSDAGIQISFEKEGNQNQLASHEERSQPTTKPAIPDTSEFDPLRKKRGSKVECGKGDIDLSGLCGISSVNQSPSKSSLLQKLPRSPFKTRSTTGESVSTMDLGGKEDYIYLAANQICLAQDCEANAKYDLAFSYYKSGVDTLLKGVQGDKNKARRDAVRRKTAQYLLKAEDLYNRHLSKEILDDRRWASENSKIPPSMDLDPGIAMLKGSLSEMKNFKVLGTIDKVMLVMDKTNDETYVIKVVHKASFCTKKTRTVLPTSSPYSVSLHKFYETEYGIFLLLHHATGGKLWNYIGSYLTGRHGSKQFGDVDNSQVYEGNVYSGVKLHTDDNAIPDRSESHVGNENQTGVSKILQRTENTDLEFMPGRENLTEANKDITVRFSNKKADTSVQDNTSKSGTSGKKPDYSRFESISSEENFNESDMSELRSNSYEHRDSSFQDLLKSNTTHLENFSINSFDSTEDHSRLNSFVSDQVATILEENELSPSHSLPRNESDNVFSEEGSELRLPEDAESIVQSARDLIKSVERTLSQSDAEVQNMFSGDNEKIVPSNDGGGGVVKKSDTVLSGNSSDTMVDSDSNELSIYDIHRNKEETSSSGSSVDQQKCHIVGGISPPEDSICDRKDTLVNSPEDELPTDLTESQSRKTSRSSTLTENVEKNRNIPVAKLSLARLNSIELSRSAPMEHELTSPPRSRQRTVSDVFQELDLAASKTEQVLIPEACIKQWMAEIVIAVARLHSQGIICRDLKPDNILLGERGHVLLTYFCTLSQVEQGLDPLAIEELFVAPEVMGVGGYNESCDWWSVGALMYELLVGRSLISCHPGGITSHSPIYLPEHISQEAQGLLKQLLCFNPRERLGNGMNGAEDIKSHPFFQDINWNSLEIS